MVGGGGFKEEDGLRDGGLECLLPFCELGPVAELLLPCSLDALLLPLSDENLLF